MVTDVAVDVRINEVRTWSGQPGNGGGELLPVFRAIDLQERKLQQSAFGLTGNTLHVLKIGPSGTSKKSTSFRIARKFVTKAIVAADEEMWGKDAAGEGLKIIAGAGSGEGVATALSLHKRVLLNYDEFSRYLKKAGAEGSILSSIVTELFDSTEYSNIIRDNAIELDGVHLGFASNMPLEQFAEESLALSQELNDPVVNNLFTKSNTVTGAARDAIWGQIDQQVMKDAGILPEVYAKSLLYRNPNLTNVYVQAYYGMYNYAVLGLKS